MKDTHSVRLSLNEELYWMLVRLASEKKMRYYDLLESWIRDAWEHRDEMPEKQSANTPECPEVPPDTPRPKGTFSEAEIDQIRALYGEHHTPGQIAKSLGRHKSSVAYAIASMKKRGEL